MEKGIATSTNPINMLDFNDDDDDEDEEQLKDGEMKRGELDGLESPTRVKESDGDEDKDEDDDQMKIVIKSKAKQNSADSDEVLADKDLGEKDEQSKVDLLSQINEIEIEEKRASQKMQDQKDKPSAEQMKDNGDETKELGQDI